MPHADLAAKRDYDRRYEQHRVNRHLSHQATTRLDWDDWMGAQRRAIETDQSLMGYLRGLVKADLAANPERMEAAS